MTTYLVTLYKNIQTLSFYYQKILSFQISIWGEGNKKKKETAINSKETIISGGNGSMKKYFFPQSSHSYNYLQLDPTQHKIYGIQES